MRSTKLQFSLPDNGKITLETNDLALASKVLALVDEERKRTGYVAPPIASRSAPAQDGATEPKKRGRPPKQQAAPKPQPEAEEEEEAAPEPPPKAPPGRKAKPVVDTTAGEEALDALATGNAKNGTHAHADPPDYIAKLTQAKKFSELLGYVVEQSGYKTRAELHHELLRLMPKVPALQALKDKLLDKLATGMATLGLTDDLEAESPF